jgi:GT2 family glycosyltransferase
MPNAPIALFVYNRPEHTRQTVTALRECSLAAQSDLFVFSDSAKNPEADAAVRQVRKYIGSIDGFGTVTIIERAENFGLARSITEGVTKLSEERGRVIVLEDDLATSPHFLEYMNAALDRYADEDRVMQIAGYMFPVKTEIKDDALFLPFISSWGWATWGRAWRHFDRREDCFERILADGSVRKRFDLNGQYKYSKILRAQQQKKIDSWAIFWYVSVFTRQGLALFPKKTLVRNLGFDGTGVNCAVSKFDQDDLDLEYRVTTLPDLIDVSPESDNVMNNIPAIRLSFAAVVNRLAGGLRRAAAK